MYTETEIKFHVKDLDKLAVRLEALGASLISPRTHEMNLRFDTPAGTLSAQACVLRLRQDAQSRLTFKSPATDINGVLSREEIEFAVGDFNAAQRFLERLGYQVIATYEKYRATYQLDDLLIMLDEMPYGDFIEIEGEDPDSIRALAVTLGLDFGAAVKMSYLQIFDLLRKTEKQALNDLTFQAFAGAAWDFGRLDLFPAD